MITTAQIFKSLADGWTDKAWSLPNDYQDFDSEFLWMDESPKPTLLEIESHYQTIAYIDERIAAYPSIEQQFDILYDSGYEGWHDAISAIKQQFPKPTAQGVTE